MYVDREVVGNVRKKGGIRKRIVNSQKHTFITFSKRHWAVRCFVFFFNFISRALGNRLRTGF